MGSGTGTGYREGDEDGDRVGNERVGKTGRLEKRALKSSNIHPANSPLKQLSILPLRKGFMSELDLALTHEARFIPSQSPGNPSLDLRPLALFPSSTQIPTILHSCLQGFHSAPGIWKREGGCGWGDYLVGSGPGSSVQEGGRDEQRSL